MELPLSVRLGSDTQSHGEPTLQTGPGRNSPGCRRQSRTKYSRNPCPAGRHHFGADGAQQIDRAVM